MVCEILLCLWSLRTTTDIEPKKFHISDQRTIPKRILNRSGCYATPLKTKYVLVVISRTRFPNTEVSGPCGFQNCLQPPAPLRRWHHRYLAASQDRKLLIISTKIVVQDSTGTLLVEICNSCCSRCSNADSSCK